jgi:hypothetical protein
VADMSARIYNQELGVRRALNRLVSGDHKVAPWNA